MTVTLPPYTRVADALSAAIGAPVTLHHVTPRDGGRDRVELRAGPLVVGWFWLCDTARRPREIEVHR